MTVQAHERPWRRCAIAALAGAVAFLSMDAAWLTFATSRIYRPGIGHLMQPGFDLWPASLFYLVYFVGIGMLVVAPSRRARDAWWRGALFGFVAYATYDFTNQATLSGWPWSVTVADLLWGTFVTSTSAALAFRIAWPRGRKPPG